MFYTDGITESRNAAGDEYGEERLVDAARRFRTLPAQEMLASLLEEIIAFNNGTYEDDATLIIAAL